MTVATDWARALDGIPFASDETTVANYGRNVSEFRRHIAGVARPRNVAEVAAVVRAANTLRGSLYPISTGANWGLGSRLPVRNGTVIVDLGAMNRVIALDLVHGTALIEPGVTQQQLHDALSESPFQLDVTGSAAETSVLGNALDRGIAHYGSRAESTRLLEVVLGTGDIVSLEHGGGAPSPLTQLYPHGLGPALQTLFFQSNYGIVTRASVRLLPRPEALTLLRCSIAEEALLPSFVDAVRALVHRGVLSASVHLSNRERSRSVLGGALETELGEATARSMMVAARFPHWSLSAPLRGHPEQVRVAERLARRALGRYGKVALVRERHLRLKEQLFARLRTFPFARQKEALARVSRTFLGHSLGIPSGIGLASLAWTCGESPPPRALDEGATGTLFVLPLVPMEGGHVRAALDIAQTVTSSHSLVPYITFNASAHVFEMVLNVTFARSDAAACARAHACAASLFERFSAAGYLPYRAGIDDMPRFVQPGAPFWELAARLKSVFDPHTVIAPGRYNLL